MRTIRLGLVLFVVVGCGPAGGGGDGDGGGDGSSIVVEPADAVLEVLNGSIPTLPYTATLHRADGTTEDVTASAVFTLEDTLLGSFDASTLRPSGTRAGRSTVRATFEGTSGTTDVTIRLRTIRVIDPAPPGSPDVFGAATEDPGRAPTVVYPSDRTMVPPNLGDFEAHWSDSAGNDLFEIALSTPLVDVTLYAAPPADPSARWAAFTPDEWAIVGQSARGGSLKLTVRGLQQAAPQTAGTSSAVAIRVGLEDLVGGLYYWAASASGIYRHDFGQPGTPAQPFYTPTETGRCVACHALSRDGTRMAVTFDGGDGEATVIDVASRTPLFPAGTLYSNFAVFDPSATRMLAVRDGALTLRDPTTAAVITTVPTGGWATHPDWSPIGDEVVYVMPASPGDDWWFSSGRLVVQPFDAASDTFGAQRELVPTGAENVYYPTFSPDGQWVLFNRSSPDGNNNFDAYDDLNAQIWVVRTDGTQAPMLVSTPNVGPGLTNSWARWAPFEQQSGGETSEPTFWFTFSSKRAFGVRMAAGTRPQIWMAPFFPQRAAAGTDPSLPAFRLPSQDLATSNHIAQWTEVVVPIE